VFRTFFLPLIALTVLFSLGWTRADELGRRTDSNASKPIDALLRAEFEHKYPGARIDLNSEIRWTRGEPALNPREVRILEETARGEARFSMQDTVGVRAEGWISFSAWVPTWVAARRIRPGEKIRPDMVSAQEVNVATGQAREYRGVILQRDTQLSGLEARQTIIEGQFFTTTAVQKVPDIRRGDAVTVRIHSGELLLTTRAVAEEPAYIDGSVRVITSKTKRQLVGSLIADGIVEVRL